MDIFNIACLSCNKWIKRDAYETLEDAQKEKDCPYCDTPKITVYP